LVFLTAAVVAVGLGASASSAQTSAALTCGSVVTEDTTLTRNLWNCEDGLEIAGTGITLDMGGHTIAGTGSAGVGLRITGDEVTITDGRITGFGTGVYSLGSPPQSEPAPIFHLLRVRVVGNTGGVSAYGALPPPASESSIVSSEISRNTDYGISINRVRLAVIESSVRANGANGSQQLEAAGRYEGNDISNNGGHGVYALDSHRVGVIGSTLNRNGGSGLYSIDRYPDPPPYVEGNRAIGNGVLGLEIYAWWPGPWEGLDGGGNIAKHNGDERQCVVEGLSPGNPAPPDALVCSRVGNDL
jgi:hypothetical protein